MDTEGPSATPGQDGRKWRVVLVGNPGVGKSFLLSALTGDERTFKSGVSVGGGLTRRRQSVFHDGIEWIDTPGLADIEEGHKNAEQVTLALKKSDENEIIVCIFVMTLSASGEVRQEDVETMQSILNGINHDNDHGPFVIINKSSSPPPSYLSINSRYVLTLPTVTGYMDTTFLDDLKAFVTHACHLTRTCHLQWHTKNNIVYKDRLQERKISLLLNQQVEQMRHRVTVARRQRFRTNILYTVVGIGVVVAGVVQFIRMVDRK